MMTKVSYSPIATGIEIKQLEKLMSIYAKKGQELSKSLEASEVVQRAKFQARWNYAHGRILEFHQQNRHLYEIRQGVEKEYLM